MTPETTHTGWLLIIASTILLAGALVVAYCRSALAERRNEPTVPPAADLGRIESEVTLDFIRHTRDAQARILAASVPRQRDRLTAECDDAFYTAPRDGGEF